MFGSAGDVFGASQENLGVLFSCDLKIKIAFVVPPDLVVLRLLIFNQLCLGKKGLEFGFGGDDLDSVGFRNDRRLFGIKPCVLQMRGEPRLNVDRFADVKDLTVLKKLVNPNCCRRSCDLFFCQAINLAHSPYCFFR